MLALLRTRRWLGFTAVVVVAIVAFGLLSAWQWQRAEQRRGERLVITSSLEADPSALSDVLAHPPTAGQWKPVIATGTFDVDNEVLVRSRPQSGSNGLWVLTPLIASDQTAVWVIRGWVAAAGSSLESPQVPAPDAGQVTVTGVAHEFESATASDNEGLPEGQVAAASMATLPGLTSTAAVAPFVIRSTQASEGLQIVPVPEVDEGRNVSYAVQWLLFALVAVAGWFYFLWREAREDKER